MADQEALPYFGKTFIPPDTTEERVIFVCILPPHELIPNYLPHLLRCLLIIIPQLSLPSEAEQAGSPSRPELGMWWYSKPDRRGVILPLAPPRGLKSESWDILDR